MKNVFVVIGTRPDAIKMAPLIKELRMRDGVDCRVICCGQHKEILADVLEERGIVPNISFSVMREGQSLASLTERLISCMRKTLEGTQVSLIAVHGDTTTALCSALVAFSLGIPIAHVEAGLRSGDLMRPYPEEMNRRAIALLASLHFAPSVSSAENLYREGIEKSRVFITGNTVYDALIESLDDNFSHPILDWVADRRFALLTAHRRENKANLLDILLGVRDALSELDIPAVFPVHPSKETKDAAEKVFASYNGVYLSPPLAPYEFQNLLARCYVAITDSGGVQEEAPALSKPVLVLRDKTERIDELASGALILGGTSRESVRASLVSLLSDGAAYQRAANAKSRADIGAACRIADIICDFLKPPRAQAFR